MNEARGYLLALRRIRPVSGCKEGRQFYPAVITPNLSTCVSDHTLCSVAELGERGSTQTKNGRKFIAVMATIEALRGFGRAKSEATP